MSLNSKQEKATLRTGNHINLPQADRETAQKWQKRVWVWCLRLVVLIVYATTRSLISLAWCSPTAQAKGLFQDSK